MCIILRRFEDIHVPTCCNGPACIHMWLIDWITRTVYTICDRKCTQARTCTFLEPCSQFHVHRSWMKENGVIVRDFDSEPDIESFHYVFLLFLWTFRRLTGMRVRVGGVTLDTKLAGAKLFAVCMAALFLMSFVYFLWSIRSQGSTNQMKDEFGESEIFPPSTKQ